MFFQGVETSGEEKRDKGRVEMSFYLTLKKD